MALLREIVNIIRKRVIGKVDTQGLVLIFEVDCRLDLIVKTLIEFSTDPILQRHTIFSYTDTQTQQAHLLEKGIRKFLP